MRRTVLLLASTTLALLACGVVFVAAVEGPAEATFAGENGKIAYRSYNRDDGGGGIYVMNPDGSGQTHVANTGGGPEVQPPGSADILPSWSPDGTKIAFARATSINDIFITNPDGSNQTNITNTPDVYEGWPAWSPDGSRIVFVRQQLDEPDAEIYVMDTDGSNVTPVTNNGVDDFSPTWSPNGTEIAFSRINYNQDASNGEIYTMKPDGVGVRLTVIHSRGWS
jgi:Tol biopolymer transport system component